MPIFCALGPTSMPPKSFLKEGRRVQTVGRRAKPAYEIDPGLVFFWINFIFSLNLGSKPSAETKAKNFFSEKKLKKKTITNKNGQTCVTFHQNKI